MSTDKRQFLDPISTISRIILLHFSPHNTKIRILDHTVQLVDDSLAEKIYRTVYYRDNRSDICVLYPIFVRYIELYLIDKEKKLNNKNIIHSIEVENIPEADMTLEEISYKYLRKLGYFAISGIKELQRTYDYDNVVFTLQYFIELIKQGNNSTYSDNSLPEHLKELTKNNLLDDSKVQKIWEDSHIIELGKTFETCFEAEKKNDKIILESNKKKILDILEKHDEVFKKMLGTDGNK
jgi:DNA-binding transcriptional ArsR family regulator